MDKALSIPVMFVCVADPTAIDETERAFNLTVYFIEAQYITPPTILLLPEYSISEFGELPNV